LSAENFLVVFLPHFLSRIDAFDILHVDSQIGYAGRHLVAHYVVGVDIGKFGKVEKNVFALFGIVAPVDVVDVFRGVFRFGVGNVDIEAAAEHAAVVESVHHGVAFFVQALVSAFFKNSVGAVLVVGRGTSLVFRIADVADDFLHRKYFGLAGVYALRVVGHKAQVGVVVVAGVAEYDGGVLRIFGVDCALGVEQKVVVRIAVLVNRLKI